jgi:hypothetical protein
MDEHKAVSISRVYVPNAYTVYLSPGDREPLSTYEQGLQRELSDYLLEHARTEGLALLTRPTVEFNTDDRLRLGEFGIQTQLVEPPGAPERAEPAPPNFGHTMVYSPEREARPLEAPPLGPAGRSLLVGAGKRRVLTPPRVVVGRSAECDVVLDDPNVSRRHAELRNEDGRWVVADLGSTNGVRVNGRAVQTAALEPGDEIAFGRSVLSFERE